MTTTADLIASTKRLLLAGQVEVRNRLTADISPGASSMVLDFDVSGITAGAVLQIDLELFYVYAVDPTSRTLTISGAQDGSAASAHDAGDTVVIDPKFPDFAVFNALNDDLADLSSPTNGLYRVRTVTIPYTAGRGGYDLTGVSDLTEVQEVRYDTGGLPGDWMSLTGVSVGRNLPTSSYASGNALFISDGGANGRDMVVTYRAPFGSLTSLSDDVATATGLPATAHDLPPMGAAIRLVMGREIKRNFTDSQGDSRRSSEVPPGAVQASWRGLEGKRQQRITAEASRLATMFPERQFMPTPIEWG